MGSITAYVGGNWRKSFSSPEQLEGLVEAALREDKDLGAGAGSTANDSGVGHRIDVVIQQRPASVAGVTWLRVAWAPLREEDIIRPTEFIKDEFQDSVMQLAYAGKPRLFPYKGTTDIDARSSRLHVLQTVGEQGRGSMNVTALDVYPNGMVAVTANVTRLVERGGGMLGFGMDYIDPDDVQTRLAQAWGFASRFWEHIDKFGRYNALLYNTALYDVGRSRWGKAPVGRTSFTYPYRDAPDPFLVFDRPKRITRSDLLEPAAEIGETLDMLQMRFTEMNRL